MKTQDKKNNSSRKKKRKKTGVSLKFLLPLLIGGAVLLIDQLTKYWIQLHIPRMTHEAQWYPYQGIGLFENFLGIEGSIVHTINYGAAWGMFSGLQVPLFALRVLLIMGLCLYLILFNQNKALVIPFCLVIFGALGNIFDYFIYGHVIDMIHFVFWGYDYPVFNIADSAIFIGMAFLLVIPWCQQRGYVAQS